MCEFFCFFSCFSLQYYLWYSVCLDLQERAAIELWLAKEPCSPLTRRPLRLEDLRPNRSLKDSIVIFRQAALV
jgi:hypothetical protein